MNSIGYYVIQSWMVSKLKLKGLNLLVYAIIFGYIQYGENHNFSGSNPYLVKMTGATRNGIQKSLKFLIDNNFIFKNTRKYKNQIFNSYTINFDILDIKENNVIKSL